MKPRKPRPPPPLDPAECVRTLVDRSLRVVLHVAELKAEIARLEAELTRVRPVTQECRGEGEGI